MTTEIFIPMGGITKHVSSSKRTVSSELSGPDVANMNKVIIHSRAKPSEANGNKATLEVGNGLGVF